MKKKIIVLLSTMLIIFGIGCVSASAEKMYVKVSYDFQLVDAPSKWANETGMWVNGWSSVNSIGWKNGYNQVITDYGAIGYIPSNRLSDIPHKLTATERQKYVQIVNDFLDKNLVARWVYFDSDYYCLWVGGSGHVVVQPVGTFMTRIGYQVVYWDGEIEITPDGRILNGYIQNSNNNSDRVDF